MTDMELTGLDQLRQMLDEMGKVGNRVGNKALREAAQPILEEARRNAPMDTGKGREGLSVGRPRMKGDTRSILIGIQEDDMSEIFYMKFHEFGTSKMIARPFLAPAFEEKKDEARRILAQAIRRGLGL